MLLRPRALRDLLPAGRTHASRLPAKGSGRCHLRLCCSVVVTRWAFFLAEVALISTARTCALGHPQNLDSNNGPPGDFEFEFETREFRIGPEGDDSRSRTVSCRGNTRFRLYRRDGSSDPWTKYRDHVLGPNQLEITYVIVWEMYSGSDTKFVIDSESGAWHRNTGWLLDY